MTIDQRNGQRIFLSIGVFFMVFLVSVAIYRSNARTSVLSVGAVSDGGVDDIAALGSPGQDRSRLQLQEFHRLEVKDGKPIWEVRAKNAKYFGKENVTHVNDASLVIFEEKKPSMELSSNTAKLYSKGDGLSAAELDGGIKVVLNQNMTLETDLAHYDAVKREITIPGFVEIFGNGFKVNGVGMDMDIDRQYVRFLSQVKSEFETWAKIPKGVEKVTKSIN